jgi:cell division septation protein DedD
MSPVAVSLNILLLVTEISAAVWYYLRPEIPMPTSASEVPAEKSSPKIEAEVSVQERVQPPQPAALKAETHEEPSAVDSLDLVKGDFTIVLGTFRKEETALNESRRLRAGGVSAFVWPAMVNGTKYFRLATGKFSSGTAAAVELKDMPGDLARGACIQKVIKGAVIHGKQQL